jgi:diketogulonate reductase-like aldo/keto reductase
MSRTVDSVLRYGYRLFDSAPSYKNDAELGFAIEQSLPKHGLTRSDIFITSKLLPQLDNTAELIPQLFEDILLRLRTDYVDLLLVHHPAPRFGKELTADESTLAAYRKDIWLAFEALLAAGKVRSIGVSNYNTTHLEEMRAYASVRPAVNQYQFNIHDEERALRDYCRKEEIFFQAFRAITPRLQGIEIHLTDESVVKRLAEKKGVKPAVLLLSHALSQGVGVIARSTNDEHIRENFQCVVRLSEGEIAELNTRAGSE